MKPTDRRWRKPGPVHRPMTLILAALLLLSQSAVLPTAVPAAALPQSTAVLTPVADEITDREPYNGYLVYQGEIPEVQEFLREIRR